MNAPIGLDSLFKEKIFRIPDYQRGYAWQKPQLKDFWEDLINLNPQRSHYTGVITLKESTSEIKESSNEYWLVDDHSYKVYDIVDGQQRLTSCVIFLQSLVEFIRDLPENEGKKEEEIYLTDTLNLKRIIENYIYQQIPSGNQFRTYKFGYTTDNPSYEYMRFRVFNEPNAGSIEETFYTLNLKNAKIYFKGQLEAYHEAESWQGIQELYKKITKKFLFNEYIIQDDFDVFVAFETMNNRGKNLSKLELLKNRLIYLTNLYPDDELNKAARKDLRDSINNAWKEVYYQLGRNDKKPLNDDDFLKAHWTMSFPYSRKTGDDYINFLLNNYFSPKRIYKKVEREIIIEHPQEVTDHSDIEDTDEDIHEDETKTVSESSLSPVKIKEYVDSLRASAVHWFNTHYPYFANETILTSDEKKWIDKLNRIGMAYFRPLLMSILKNQSTERLDILKKIERFIFINFLLNQARRNYGDSEFYNASREFDQKNLSINDLINKLSEREKYSYDENQKFINKDFEDYIYKRFSMGDKKGFYGWTGIKYFLYEYELSKMERSGQKKVEWELFIKNEKDKVSIEHIFPQKPTDETWAKAFEDVSESEYHIYSGSLGNLLPLSLSINSSLQNDPYSEKKKPKLNEKSEKIRNGYADGSHSEIEVSLNYQHWTPETIQQRGLSLLNFMEERWQIDLGDEAEKMKLLQLKKI
jgi:uncharacterized protein with ParB-like and HNH nuclease domain